MDLIERIEELQVLMEEAKAVPLSASAVVNRDEILELLAELKQELPDEVRQARWTVRDRDEIMERARREAEKILEQSRAERARLIDESALVGAAREEAAAIVAEARAKADELRRQAEDYVDTKLATFEKLLNRTLSSVVRGREELSEGAGPERPSGGSSRRTPPFNVEELQEGLGPEAS